MHPADYAVSVSAGIDALRAAEDEFRARVGRRPDEPELWLRVRDAEGLADRLESVDDGMWRESSGDAFIVAQDLGALDELAADFEAGSPYRDDPAAPERTAIGARLRAPPVPGRVHRRRLHLRAGAGRPAAEGQRACELTNR
jgi:hypothetical protein